MSATARAPQSGSFSHCACMRPRALTHRRRETLRFYSHPSPSCSVSQPCSRVYDAPAGRHGCRAVRANTPAPRARPARALAAVLGGGATTLGSVRTAIKRDTRCMVVKKLAVRIGCVPCTTLCTQCSGGRLYAACGERHSSQWCGSTCGQRRRCCAASLRGRCTCV
jgi:hypothetical protein